MAKAIMVVAGLLILYVLVQFIKLNYALSSTEYD